MEAWAADFDSWDLCDQATTSLFDLTPFAWDKAREWARRSEEWVRRAGFALMAGLAVHDKVAADGDFEALFPLIEEMAFDERNFVKKARQLGVAQHRQTGPRVERGGAGLRAAHPRRRRRARRSASRRRRGSRSARWVANDALRELASDKVRARLVS